MKMIDDDVRILAESGAEALLYRERKLTRIQVLASGGVPPHEPLVRSGISGGMRSPPCAERITGLLPAMYSMYWLCPK